MRWPALGILCLIGALTACAGPSMRRVEAECAEQARATGGVRLGGTAAIGVGSEGAVSDLDLSVTGTTAMAGDPALIYDACVRRQSGQGPARPLGV